MITIGQAIRNAVETERAAARFYRTLAERAGEPDACAFLFDMASQEDQHTKALEELGARTSAAEMLMQPDAHVQQIETAPGWQFHEGTDLDEALAVALEAETNAVLYYDALAGSCTGPLREFFERLTKSEEDHVRRVQAKMEARRLGR